MPISVLAAQPRSTASIDATLAAHHPSGNALRELTIADGASADIGELVSSVRTRLLLLGPSGRALARISSAIEGCRPDVLHIVAHGRPGAISLGGEWIGTRALAAASGMVSSWQVGTIALWCCHGGADQALGQVLAALTGARVLVSSGPLGLVDGVPRWDLHDADGAALPARFSAPFAPQLMDSWPHQLGDGASLTASLPLDDGACLPHVPTVTFNGVCSALGTQDNMSSGSVAPQSPQMA